MSCVSDKEAIETTAIQYGGVAWVNIWGLEECVWTGRIPQSCVTRAMRWQESATYFSMRIATVLLCLIALFYPFLILPACRSLFPLFLSRSGSEPPPPPLSFVFHCFIFVLSACSVCVSLVCLFYLFCLSVFQSRHLFCCPTLPHVFLTLHFVLMHLLLASSNIQAFRYLYSKRHYSVIVLWFLHSPTLHPCIFFLYQVCHSLSIFFCGTLSSVLQVLSEGCWGAGERDKKYPDLYIFCMLVNMALVCLLLMMQCTYSTWWCWPCMIYMLGSHTQAEGFHIDYLYSEWRNLQGLTYSLADSGGDRQTPRYLSVSAEGRCGDLTQSEPCTHAPCSEHVCKLHRCTVCTVESYWQPHLKIPLFLCILCP